MTMTEIRHVGPNPPDRGHGDHCYCGRKARWHVSYGSGCGNVCGTHKNAILRIKRSMATAHQLS